MSGFVGIEKRGIDGKGMRLLAVVTGVAFFFRLFDPEKDHSSAVFVATYGARSA
jgi:hypothetical protein